MTYLSDLRKFRQIARQAVMQYPFTNTRIDYILTRHISNQAWLYLRSGNLKIKKYMQDHMSATMKILKAGLK